MKRAIAIVILIISSLLFWYDQSRAFYCLSEDKCITVWKRLGDKCYVIPGKYYGIFKPTTTSYARTLNNGIISVFYWERYFVFSGTKSSQMQIINGNNCILYYEKRELYYDSIFIDPLDGRIRDGIDFMTIDIKENYARGIDGKRL